MGAIESGGTVLHRGREAREILEEEAAELAEQQRTLTTAERDQMIAQAAYFRAQKRDFAPGHELEDWLEAEAELRTQLEWA